MPMRLQRETSWNGAACAAFMGGIAVLPVAGSGHVLMETAPADSMRATSAGSSWLSRCVR